MRRIARPPDRHTLYNLLPYQLVIQSTLMKEIVAGPPMLGVIDSPVVLRILVVDDAKPVCQLLARILRPPRYELIQALSTEEARKHLIPPPSLIILDLGLAGESGEDFCHSIHRDPLTQDVPILILAGRDTPDLDDSSVATCAEDLVYKPIDSAELIFHVEATLKKAAYKVRHFTQLQ